MNKNINSEQAKKDTLLKIETINAVEGFDPKSLALKISDMNDGTERYHLPVMPQMAWFRLKYPDGKIKVSVKQGNNCFIGEARVYAHYNDPADCYLAEGSASRGYIKEKPAVQPREWAQTSAIGAALRNAGFGLQFYIAGESFEGNTVNEFVYSDGQEIPGGEFIPENTVPAETSGQMSFSDESQSEVKNGESTYSPVQPELKPLEKAMAAMCPILKYKDKKLGDMIRIDPGALAYVAKSADKYGEEIAAYATLICENALQQTQAS